MTGEEYWKLSKGDTVEVIAPVNEDSKVGDILKVEYINVMKGIIYCRDSSKPIGSQIYTVFTSEALECLEMTDKPVENKNIIKLPFAINDNVWFMFHDKAFLGRISGYRIASIIATGKPSIKYNITFRNSGNYTEYAENIPSDKCFNTKEKLLATL